MNNINEIILKAQKGDDKALDEIYNQYKGYVSVIAKKYYLIDGNNDDIVQEGMIGFCKAVNTFKPDKGYEFLPYLKKLVEHQIINAIKKANSLKNSLLNESLNLNNQGELVLDEERSLSLPSDDLSPENSVLQEEESKDFYLNVNKKLSQYEKQVLSLYLSGFKYSDIIKKLNTNYKSVDNALARIKNKIQHMGEE